MLSIGHRRTDGGNRAFWADEHACVPEGKCLGTELNRRRRPFQGRALPTELPRLENLIKLTEEVRTRKDRNWKCCGTLNQSCETNAGVPRDIDACVLTAFRYE